MIDFIADLLEDYKLSSNNKEKKELLDKFKKELWSDKYKNYKYKKRIHYQVKEELFANQELIDLFNKYNDIKYSVQKSYYKDRNKITSVDYIRIHINNLYSNLFDKNTYFPKEYYENLFVARNLYFKVIKLSEEEQLKLNIELLDSEIKESLGKAKNIKENYIVNKKCDLKFSEYKKIINRYIEKIFENYIIFEDYKEEFGWDYSVIPTTIVFGEENYTIRYFNKSLSGYMRNYFREQKGIKRVRDGNKTAGMFKIAGIFDKFSILQIGISKFYNNEDDLLNVNDKYLKQLTPKQKELIKDIENVVDYDDILFYENGLPYFKWLNLSEKLNILENTIRKCFDNIYNRIQDIKNGKKFCECCGRAIKIKSKTCKPKYCKQCAKDVQNKQKLNYYYRNLEKV